MSDIEEGEAYRFKGDDLLKRGELKSAIAAYCRAVVKNPDSVWNLNSLAVAAGLNGWQVVARNFYIRALAINAAEVRRWHEEHPLHIKECPRIQEPVFVIGAPHSGTTIMTRLIGAHPAIMHAEYKETFLFMKSDEEISENLIAWDQACVGSGKSRWIEKSVIHTVLIPKVLEALPKAKFIVALRDGRDVVSSLKTRKYVYRNLDELLDQWIWMNRAVYEYIEHPNFTFIKYEDLVSDTEGTLKQVCHAIGEDYAPEMLAYHNQKIEWNSVEFADKAVDLGDQPSHAKLRAWQINQPLFDGRNRWQSDLDEPEKKQIKQRAQEDLVKYGYVKDDTW